MIAPRWNDVQKIIKHLVGCDEHTLEMCTSLNNLPKTIMWNWCSCGGFLFWRWHGQPFNGRLLGDSCVWASGLSHQQTLFTPTFYRLAALVYGHSAQIGEGEIDCPEKDGNGQSIGDVSHPKGGRKQSTQGKCWPTMSSWVYDTFSWYLRYEEEWEILMRVVFLSWIVDCDTETWCNLTAWAELTKKAFRLSKFQESWLGVEKYWRINANPRL